VLRPADNAIVERFYRWNAPIYDLTRRPILRGRREAVEAMGLSPGMSVLEVGCGTGINLPWLQAGVGAAGRVVGVDYSAAMLTRARRRATANTVLLQADASLLALHERFDAALLAYSLTIIPNWEAALERCCRHLRPGGRVVVLDFGRCDDDAPLWRKLWRRHLARCHVDCQRDLLGALQRHVERVEVLRPVTAYCTILRGVAAQMA
jgi:ubiquinone/menaquinone biosynthesis C-methylase UbiE